MIFCDFHNKVKKLNHRLWADVDRESTQRYPDYPVAGLYIDNKFIMGIPHNNVPEYSIAALDMNSMLIEGRQEELKEALETGYCNEESIVCRGWRAIVSGLIRLQYVSKEKAERVFSTHFDNRKEFPRNYINKSN